MSLIIRQLNISRYFLLLTIVFSQLSFGQNQNPEQSAQFRTRISFAVQKILTMETFPIIKDPFLEPTSYFQEPFSPETIAAFNRLQALVSEKNRFSLGRTDKSTLAMADMGKRSVHVNTRFISKLEKLIPKEHLEGVIAMILAHEMGHYFYEAIVQTSKNKKSPNGNRSSISGPRMSTEEYDYHHGEVDAIGAYLIELAGYNVDYAIMAINETLKVSTISAAALPYVEQEKRIRLFMIQEYMKK